MPWPLTYASRLGRALHVCPVLVESFVDPTRFSGAGYKAANWLDVGQSAGRRDGKPKRVFLHPLCPGWREILCSEPPIRLGDIPRPERPEHWAEEEFGTVRLYDHRLKQRLYKIGQDFYGQPQAGIPEACAGRARTMGADRLFHNPKVTMDVVLKAHKEATLERIKAERVLLAPQDTTTLNYSTHPMTEGLGPIRNTNDTSMGLLLHDTWLLRKKAPLLASWMPSVGHEIQRTGARGIAVMIC